MDPLWGITEEVQQRSNQHMFHQKSGSQKVIGRGEEASREDSDDVHHTSQSALTESPARSLSLSLSLYIYIYINKMID